MGTVTYRGRGGPIPLQSFAVIIQGNEEKLCQEVQLAMPQGHSWFSLFNHFLSHSTNILCAPSLCQALQEALEARKEEGKEGSKELIVFEHLQYVKHRDKLLKNTVFCNLHINSVGKTVLICYFLKMKMQSLNER